MKAMTDDEMFDWVVALHDIWVNKPSQANWDRFAAARDAWLQGGGGTDGR